MGIASKLEKAFRGATDSIDGVSAHDKLILKQKLEEFRWEVINKAIEYDRIVLDAQAQVVTDNFSPKSWIQKNWKPIGLRILVTLAVLEACDVLPLVVPEKILGILERILEIF